MRLESEWGRRKLYLDKEIRIENTSDVMEKLENRRSLSNEEHLLGNRNEFPSSAKKKQSYYMKKSRIKKNIASRDKKTHALRECYLSYG